MVSRTTLLKEKEAKHQWWIVDLSGKTLGRVATQIADVLRGKDKRNYTPNVDGGDFVVAINADKIHLTGKKWDDKKYYQHSLYPGGLKTWSAKQLQTRHPEALLTKAVKGMLPRNKLAAQFLKKLKVYGGTEHPHVAQGAKVLELK